MFPGISFRFQNETSNAMALTMIRTLLTFTASSVGPVASIPFVQAMFTEISARVKDLVPILQSRLTEESLAGKGERHEYRDCCRKAEYCHAVE